MAINDEKWIAYSIAFTEAMKPYKDACDESIRLRRVTWDEADKASGENRKMLWIVHKAAHQACDEAHQAYKKAETIYHEAHQGEL